MKTVRASRGGTLANVPMSVVLQEASELLSASTVNAALHCFHIVCVCISSAQYLLQCISFLMCY